MRYGEFYAHTPGEIGEWHMLVPHLERTAEAAAENAAKFGAGELGRLAGLWHDLGKFNMEFQGYLRRCHEATLDGGAAPRKGVPHAIYGAALARETVSLLAPVLYGHHAGLPQRAKAQDALESEELREPYERILSSAREEVGELGFDGNVGDLISNPPGDHLQMELFVRMVFSALVDADFLDTEHHFDPEVSSLRGSMLAPDDLWRVLERQQERLVAEARSTPVNVVRGEVYRSCLEASRMPQGVFRLSVPTGGGKTRSGLAFALRHTVEHELDRVIVAAPYTSIIEQTAQEYRGIFEELGGEAVLEHHSAVRRDKDDSGEAEDQRQKKLRTRLCAQNWDAPLIVTTTVQLMESLFANRTSRCRKLHNISRSVIVIDEVQTLPARLLEPILSALGELVRRYEVTVVLCTATQPALEGQSRYLSGFDSVSDIVEPGRAADHFSTLRRVDYETPDEEWSWETVAERLRRDAPDRRAMAVLNTRKDALALLEALEGEPLLHLSTRLCGAHRRDVLNEVRRRLDADEPCLLVATQVVEAGVDLDFPVVFRAIGPLDRIVQAAGRCNREGRMDGMGRVVVFQPEEGGLPPGEYEKGAYEAGKILRRDGLDLHDPAIFGEYFARLYQDVDTDAEKIQELRKSYDYPEVSRRFRLISESSVPVIVQYQEADPRREAERQRLIERIRREGELRGGDHRKLQPYTVSLFEREFEQNSTLAEEIAEGVYLWRGDYDGLLGIRLEGGLSVDDLIF